MTAPETCPHCGAEQASFPEAASPGFYACDTCVYDDRNTQRGTPCYEAEIARLKARCEKLETALRDALEGAKGEWATVKNHPASRWANEVAYLEDVLKDADGCCEKWSKRKG